MVVGTLKGLGREECLCGLVTLRWRGKEKLGRRDRHSPEWRGMAWHAELAVAWEQANAPFSELTTDDGLSRSSPSISSLGTRRQGLSPIHVPTPPTDADLSQSTPSIHPSDPEPPPVPATIPPPPLAGPDMFGRHPLSTTQRFVPDTSSSKALDWTGCVSDGRTDGRTTA